MYAGPAGVLFVEYKYVAKLPKRDNTIIRHSLSPLQEQWLTRMKDSTLVGLVLGCEDSALIIVDDFSANICKSKYVEQANTTTAGSPVDLRKYSLRKSKQ